MRRVDAVSRLDADLRAGWAQAGRDQDLYPFEFEVPFGGLGGGRRFRFDLAARRQRLAIEVHGGVYMAKARHTSGVGFERDRVKMNEAALAGWRVIEVTTGQVTQGLAAWWALWALGIRHDAAHYGARESEAQAVELAAEKLRRQGHAPAAAYRQAIAEVRRYGRNTRRKR